MRLAELHVYPLKSAASVALTEVEVEARGLHGDRRWMVVDAEGRFITGREAAQLTLVRSQITADGLVLDAPGMPPLRVATPGSATTTPVRIWKSELEARPATSEAQAWLTQFLARPARLVHMDAGVVRSITSSHGRPGDEVSFADSFPVLLISRAALNGLNARLNRPVSMLRFRPNLVVDGVPAHAEDGWKRIRIGSVEFEVAKPCVRCVFTTVDPDRGERDDDGEPLRTLIGYRRSDEGVTFGQNLIPRSKGRLRVDDRVEILA